MRQKLLLLLLGVLSTLPAFARDFDYTYEGQTITYTVIDEDAKTCCTKPGHNHTAGNSVSGNVILPEKPKDGDVEYTLIEIGEYAFGWCQSLTSVVIPDSVTSIGEAAFSCCSGLSKAEFSSIESICNISFGDTSANPLSYAEHLYIDGEEVTELLIPESVTSIGDKAFYS